MISSRKTINIDKNYIPYNSKRGDEIFSVNYFKINITGILEHIKNGSLMPIEERIDVSKWMSSHFRNGTLHESHLLNVDLSKPVIQAEVRPEHFELIDGNHRIIKALRQGVKYIDSYKLSNSQLIPFFCDRLTYERFVELWNEELSNGELLCDLFR